MKHVCARVLTLENISVMEDVRFAMKSGVVYTD